MRVLRNVHFVMHFVCRAYLVIVGMHTGQHVLIPWRLENGAKETAARRMHI